MANILIVSSNVHKELSARQLELCRGLLEKTAHNHQVVVLEAGTYEIPFVINTYQKLQPFDAYIALGLVVKTNPDHYHYITSHIQTCFTHFALQGIIVGNGILSAASVEELHQALESPDPCLSAWPSAVRAVTGLLEMQEKITN